jgi:hypothetical protein
MKTLANLFGLLLLVFIMTGCDLFDKKKDVDTVPEYQKAIEAKYKAIGWTNGLDNGGTAIQTAGKKGWVQYYGGKDRAIYYFENTAYAVLNFEMKKYDQLGQDNFALITSDYVSLKNNAGYIAIKRLSNSSEGLIITNPAGVTTLIDGEIYKKYKALDRWDGVLGYPIIDELDLGSKKGRYQHFSKNPAGTPYTAQIYYSAATGAHAFWGRIDKLYDRTGYDSGWLGLPITSCDPARVDKLQVVKFQNGTIDAADCGSYTKPDGTPLKQDGTRPATGLPPCYY